MAQLWQQGIRSAHRLDEQTHGWLGLLAGAAWHCYLSWPLLA
jgi:hypothetical protein